jgi:hypothetical protein
MGGPVDPKRNETHECDARSDTLASSVVIITMVLSTLGGAFAVDVESAPQPRPNVSIVLAE